MSIVNTCNMFVFNGQSRFLQIPTNLDNSKLGLVTNRAIPTKVTLHTSKKLDVCVNYIPAETGVFYILVDNSYYRDNFNGGQSSKLTVALTDLESGIIINKTVIDDEYPMAIGIDQKLWGRNSDVKTDDAIQIEIFKSDGTCIFTDTFVVFSTECTIPLEAKVFGNIYNETKTDVTSDSFTKYEDIGWVTTGETDFITFDLVSGYVFVSKSPIPLNPNLTPGHSKLGRLTDINNIFIRNLLKDHPTLKYIIDSVRKLSLETHLVNSEWNKILMNVYQFLKDTEITYANGEWNFNHHDQYKYYIGNPSFQLTKLDKKISLQGSQFLVMVRNNTIYIFVGNALSSDNITNKIPLVGIIDEANANERKSHWRVLVSKL